MVLGSVGDGVSVGLVVVVVESSADETGVFGASASWILEAENHESDAARMALKARDELAALLIWLEW